MKKIISLICSMIMVCASIPSFVYAEGEDAIEESVNSKWEAWQSEIFYYEEESYPPFYEPCGYNAVGDLNGDHKITMADAVMLECFLLGKYRDVFSNAIRNDGSFSHSADINGDKCLDVFDLVALKQMILSQEQEQV